MFYAIRATSFTQPIFSSLFQGVVTGFPEDHPLVADPRPDVVLSLSDVHLRGDIQDIRRIDVDLRHDICQDIRLAGVHQDIHPRDLDILQVVFMSRQVDIPLEGRGRLVDLLQEIILILRTNLTGILARGVNFEHFVFFLSAKPIKVFISQ